MIHTDRDYLFSRAFAIPHLIWVAFYSLCMLGVIQIENTPAFISMALYVQTYGITFLIFVWYIVCYANFCQDTGEQGCVSIILFGETKDTKETIKTKKLEPMDTDINLIDIGTQQEKNDNSDSARTPLDPSLNLHVI